MNITAINAWIKTNKESLTPEALVLAEAAKDLARTMDQEKKERGKVSSGVANAYRQTFAQLVAIKPGNAPAKSDKDEDLFSPTE
jgi:hypothetical protein